MKYRNTNTEQVVDLDDLEPEGREHLLSHVADGTWVKADEDTGERDNAGILSQPHQQVSGAYEVVTLPKVTTEQVDKADLEKMTVDQLKELADSLSIDVPAGTKKAELVDLVIEAERKLNTEAPASRRG